VDYCAYEGHKGSETVQLGLTAVAFLFVQGASHSPTTIRDWGRTPEGSDSTALSRRNGRGSARMLAPNS
jgi:hypothetical protein